jgi:hypothetical protein
MRARPSFHLAGRTYYYDRKAMRHLRRLQRQHRREDHRARRHERRQVRRAAVRHAVNRARALLSFVRVSIVNAITNAVDQSWRVLLAVAAYITGVPALLLTNLKSLFNMNTTTNDIPSTVSSAPIVETIHAYTLAVAALQTCSLDPDGVAQVVADIRAHSPAEAETIVRLMRENDDAWIVPQGGGAVTVQRR